jgi:hypothetical protein
MTLNRYAARTDANQAQIVKALEAAGCVVWVIRQPVDLLVGRGSRTLLMEVKDGSKPPSRRKTTPVQTSFLATWNGGPVAVVTDVESALRAVKAMG